MNDFDTRLLRLGQLRSLVVSMGWQVSRMGNAKKAVDQLLKTSVYTSGLQQIAASLGINIDEKKLFPYGMGDDNIGETLYRNCLQSDVLLSEINRKYSRIDAFIYQV